MPNDIGRRPIPARNLRIIARAARYMAQNGMTPNMISGIGLVVGVGAGISLGATQVLPDLAKGLWLASAAMVVVRGLSNMFDGMVAVEHGRGTSTGIFWNELPDRISDVALLVGAGYGLGGSPVAGWLAACLALIVAYVRILGVVAGSTADFSGPFAKQQRMFSVAALAVFLALLPSASQFTWGPGGTWGPMALLLWIMVPGIAWTTVRRLRRAVMTVSQTAHQ